VGSRSKARKRALDVLYAADVRGVAADEVLAQLEQERREARDAMNPYTAELVHGVTLHRRRIDELLSTHSEGWPLDRMPSVDRNLLRIGVFEVLWSVEVPDAVAVAEAVELAAEISTDDSPTFVNGVLGRIVRLKPMLPEGAAPTPEPDTAPEPEPTSRSESSAADG
jgi:N utilization substance protein B